MEIQKFEAYNYKGPKLMNVDRKKFIQELSGIFTGQNICGYEIGGTSYYHDDEILWLHVDENVHDKYGDSKIIQLDLSDLGIEFGNAEWNDDTEEFDEFIPEVNLDGPQRQEIKHFKKNTKKYNL